MSADRWPHSDQTHSLLEQRNPSDRAILTPLFQKDEPRRILLGDQVHQCLALLIHDLYFCLFHAGEAKLRTEGYRFLCRNRHSPRVAWLRQWPPVMPLYGAERARHRRLGRSRCSLLWTISEKAEAADTFLLFAARIAVYPVTRSPPLIFRHAPLPDAKSHLGSVARET